jgi:hypothetical protein
MSTEAKAEAEAEADMKVAVDATRAKSLVSAFHAVSERVAKAANGRKVCFMWPWVGWEADEKTGTAGRSVEIKACEWYPGAAPGTGKPGSFWGELCSGVEWEGGATTQDDSMAFYWRFTVEYVFPFSAITPIISFILFSARLLTFSVSGHVIKDSRPHHHLAAAQSPRLHFQI